MSFSQMSFGQMPFVQISISQMSVSYIFGTNVCQPNVLWPNVCRSNGFRLKDAGPLQLLSWTMSKLRIFWNRRDDSGNVRVRRYKQFTPVIYGRTRVISAAECFPLSYSRNLLTRSVPSLKEVGVNAAFSSQAQCHKTFLAGKARRLALVWSSTGVGSGLARKQQARVEASDGNKHCIKVQKKIYQIAPRKETNWSFKIFIEQPQFKVKLNAILEPRGQLRFINSQKINGSIHSRRSWCKVTHLLHQFTFWQKKKKRTRESENG